MEIDRLTRNPVLIRSANRGVHQRVIGILVLGWAVPSGYGGAAAAAAGAVVDASGTANEDDWQVYLGHSCFAETSDPADVFAQTVVVGHLQHSQQSRPATHDEEHRGLGGSAWHESSCRRHLCWICFHFGRAPWIRASCQNWTGWRIEAKCG